MAEKESEFEKLARLIKEEGDDIRSDVRDQISGVEIGGLRKEMQYGFATIRVSAHGGQAFRKCKYLQSRRVHSQGRSIT